MKQAVDQNDGAPSKEGSLDEDEWTTECSSEEESSEEEPAAEASAKEASSKNALKDIDISDARISIPELKADDLPRCPKCSGLLRPGVVWFGEPLPVHTIETVDTWVHSGPIDLMLVIGTSARVFPAADYVERGREQGARVAVINMDQQDAKRSNLGRKDWFFEGDAATIVPELLKSVIGDV